MPSQPYAREGRRLAYVTRHSRSTCSDAKGETLDLPGSGVNDLWVPRTLTRGASAEPTTATLIALRALARCHQKLAAEVMVRRVETTLPPCRRGRPDLAHGGSRTDRPGRRA